jgi:cell division protein FtsA
MDRSEQIFAAVDIGTTKVIAIAGKRNDEGKIEIIGFGHSKSQGVKRGIVFNIDETHAAIEEAVKKAEESFGGIIDEVYVNIAGQHLKTLTARGQKYIGRDNEFTEEHVAELEGQARQIPLDPEMSIYHVNPQMFIIDNESGIQNPVGTAGEKLEAVYKVHVAPDLYQRNIQKSLDKAGIKMQRAVLDPIASSEVVLTEDEKEAGVVLIDIGGGTTKMSIFRDGVLCYTAVIPFGGNVITHDIKEGCSILLRQAESLKVQFGQAMGDFAPAEKVVTIPGLSGWEPKEISFKNLAFVIQARMDEIIEAWYFHLEKSGYLDKVGAGIVLTGGTALLPNLRQLIKYRTGLDVRHGKPIMHFFKAWKELEDPRFSTALGLLLIAANDADEEIKSKLANRRNRVKKSKNSQPGFFSSIKNQVAKQVTLFFEEDQDTEMS